MTVTTRTQRQLPITIFGCSAPEIVGDLESSFGPASASQAACTESVILYDTYLHLWKYSRNRRIGPGPGPVS